MNMKPHFPKRNKPAMPAKTKTASTGGKDKSPSAGSKDKTTHLTVKESGPLLPFLIANLTHVGRNAVKSLLTHGQVSVNDKPALKHDHPLSEGQTVVIRWKREPERPPLAGLTILYEDDDLMVVEKEAGLLTIATETEKDLTAYRQLNDYVRAEQPKNRIFIVHRLDRDTSGVMMFAKSEAIQQAMQQAWQEAVEERTYIALVEGKVRKPEGKVESWLKESKTLQMYSSQRQGDGQHAVTHYKLLKAGAEFSLLEVRLETGRKNQIRVHMQDLGHSIVGDKKYGSRRNVIGRLGLHAHTLAFHHPGRDGQLMRFESKLPKVFMRPFREEEPR